nr:serine/threonine-protein kinase [Ktedonobacteraceae bacterium]
MQGQNRVGQKLGNYRLVKPLGRGGYAEVYLAENMYLGIQTAIKVLKLRDLDALEQEQFRSEASFMTTLEHPRIIKVLDYGIEMSQRGSGNDGSTPYLVMEYAPLGTLRHLYPRGTQMPLSKLVTYTKQIAEALQYAHDKDITHRDVKPENMLVRKIDDAALSDFGIAVAGLNTGNVLLQEKEILEKIARGEQVVVSGTAPYLAPERLRGHTQRASDQYSLAVIVYEWLCGSRPFDGSEAEICRKHATQPPPPLSQRFPHISQEVEQVVMKALSKEPADRYKSVREFALALENAVKASSQPATPKVTPLPTLPIQSLPPTLFSYDMIASPPQSPYLSTPPTPQPVIPPTPQLPPYQTPSPPPSPIGQNQNQRQDFQGYSNPTIPDRGATPQPDVPLQGQEDVFDTISRVFVTDPYGFSRTQRTRRFLLLGIPINILSALIVLISGPLPSSLIPAILGGVLSVYGLWRCTISVKKPIAIAHGVLVAIWWGFVAGSLAGHTNDISIIAPSFFIAFVISVGIHYWYVENRLKN